MADQSNEWLTIREAALALGVSELTVRRRIKDRRVVHRLVDGKYFVNLAAEAPRNGHAHHEPDRASAEAPNRVTDQPPDQSAGNGLGPGFGRGLDLEALLSEHARLAEQAGRAGILEDQLHELTQRYSALQEGIVSLATRNGWLESKLEEREQTLKLLTDSAKRRPWWKRIFGGSEARP